MPAADAPPTAAALLAQAESDLSVGRLRGAHKNARRASRLDPGSTLASLILASTSVLLADAVSPRAALLLADPPEHPSSLRRHYKSLARSLHPDPELPSSSPAAAAAAEKALRRVDDAYAALTADEEAAAAIVPVPPTFWTACAACRLLHKFDRQYVGYRLMCPSCRRTFLAAEVPPPPPAASEKLEPEKPRAEKPEMQLQLAKRRARDHKARKRSSVGDGAEEAEDESGRWGLMDVEDSDFYNFDADRGERCLERGQVWALYGDDDGMPRHYALLDSASPGSRFQAQLRWLELQPGGEQGKPCGQFKVGRPVTVLSVNVFSHLIAGCKRAAKEAYRVFPSKGSVWAFHGEKDGGDSGRPKYEFVVFLSGYSDQFGASYGYLEKVDGFRSIFTRRGVGGQHVRCLTKGDVAVLSHQVPARKVPKEADDQESKLPPGDCWELDPAALPAELLRVNRHKK